MLEKKITDDLKAALKEGDKVKVSALRMLIAQIKNKKIAERASELDDDSIVALLQKMVRQHKESIEQFKAGGREDLVSRETQEMTVLEKYLPEMMTQDELARVVAEEIEKAGASSPKDMGAVMGAVMARVKGRADGKAISALVREKLS